MLHNSYQQPGGEDVVFEAEKHLLAASGHEVLEYRRHNAEISNGSLISKVRLARTTVWATDTYDAVRDLVRREKPDVAYFHNFLPLISPAAYYACKEAGVRVLQTVQNYRLVCPVGMCYRDGHICEQCSDDGLWRSIQHGCYRSSRSASAAVALMLWRHRRWKTWSDAVDCYIAPSTFLRGVLSRGGVPAEKIALKPNFVYPDPGERSGEGEYALFIGRLAHEKGIRTLIDALALVSPDVRVAVAGVGPMLGELAAAAGRHHVELLGQLQRAKVFDTIKRAAFILFPSITYEGFPTTVLEAYACGVPVIGSRLGATAELVRDGHTGLLFEPGNARAFAERINWAWSHRAQMAEMGHNARCQYDRLYTAERSYTILMDIASRVVGTAAAVNPCR